MQNEFEMAPGKAGDAAGREDGDLQWLCRSVLQNAFPMFRNATVDARFYPYIGLTHTIRRKGSRWMIRISDHCRNAPTPVLEAVVMLLGSKIARRRPPERFLQTYELFRKDPSVEDSVRERRRRKGRKYIAGNIGTQYSPEEICKEVNDRFFNGQIEISRIGWGKRKGWTRLGHYDPVHNTITLSPVLDSPKVPEFVVRYIVYHEMLHALFGDSPSRGFRRHHHAEFRRAERAHPDYARAERFLREYFGRRRRGVND